MDMDKKTPVVILAGGKGLRMREYSDVLPKALVPVGEYPIILHVMRIYSFYGYNRFIIALGYKGEVIKDFFMNLEWRLHDFTIHSTQTEKKQVVNHLPDGWENFEITFADTGQETQTGGRIKKVERYVETEDFFVTYCDGLADIHISNLYRFHKNHGKIGTLTSVHPMSPFGLVEIGEDGAVKSFREKPFLKDYINGGFFVFKRSFFDHVAENEILEEEPLRKLAELSELRAFKHEGFWSCMDTFKDVDRLNSLWYSGEMLHTNYRGKPPWVNLKK